MTPIARLRTGGFIVYLAMSGLAFAQTAAPDSSERQELSEALAERPSVDTYVALARSYRRSREWSKAESLLEEGEKRFPQNPRIPTELASVYLDDGNAESARQALTRALKIDPVNPEAAELLSTIEFTEGDIKSALEVWNRSGQPIVDHVLHNSFPQFSHWTVAKAHAFTSGKLMTYMQWKTTELRLQNTEVFSSAGINVEPEPTSPRFNPVITTTRRATNLGTVGFDILKGAPLQTAYFNWWDIGHSGMSVNSKYRWDYNRRRGDVDVHAPLPVSGILFLTGHAVWRSERWDVTRILKSDAGTANRFQLNTTGLRAELQYIPNFKFDFGGGVEYTNRYGHGGVPGLLADSRNSAKILFQANLRLADDLYRNRFHVEGYVARKSIFGDLNYSAIAAEFNNAVLFSRNSRTQLNWTIRGGTSSGQVPVEDYFSLSVDTQAGNLLRAHPASRRGHYGDAPMGTSFALSNIELERRLARLPLFNTLNLSYLNIKSMVFLDSGTTWDRAGIFKEGKLQMDTGAGLRFETRTHSLNLIYAHALREGRNVVFAYIEKHW